MIIIKEVKDLLLAQAPVTTLATGGIHLFHSPNDATAPNVVLELINGGEEYTHQGPNGLEDALVRIYSKANNPREMDALGSAVKAYLRGFTGTAGSLIVQGCFHLNENGDHNDDFSIYRQIDDYRFVFCA